MIHRIAYLMLLGVVFACNPSTQINYAQDFEACLSQEDVLLLHKATRHFETLLADHYKRDQHEANFYSFLTEMGSFNGGMQFAPDFYRNPGSMAILDEMRAAGTFEKIWVPFEPQPLGLEDDLEIAMDPDYEATDRPALELYTINAHGGFLECIDSRSNNAGLKDILRSQSEFGDISTMIVAGAMGQELTQVELKEGMNKVVVAINVYYSLVSLFKSNS